MKLLKLLGVIILGLIFLVVLISFFLPGKYHVQRSITINTDVSVPFELAKNFKSWDLWSPWHEIDTAMKKTYSESIGVEGSWYTWESENPDAGIGKVTITKIIENEYIENELFFEGMGTSTASYIFKQTDAGVEVTWTLDGNGNGMPWYSNIMSKYFYLMMDKLVGTDYEKGLIKLKQVSENMPQPDKILGFEIEQRNIAPVKLAGIRTKVLKNELSSAQFAKWFAQISHTLSKQNIQPIGYPMTFYHQYGDTELEVEAAIPVVKFGDNLDNIVYRETTPIKALVVNYYGNYDNMEEVYNAAYQYLETKGITSKSSPIEIYVTDPGMEKDTAKWLTEIVFPLD